ncbi:MAG TPA: MoxR family ATPase [Blastocatellia bacterium]|nr:MoxR family ATPase [Blastocatellia bacterium]
MRPRNYNQEALNPRQAAREQGPGEIARILKTTGYVIRRATLQDLWLALDRAVPLLAGGPAGTGKTALAEALAAGFNLNLYEITGHPGQEPRDVIGSWNRRAQDRAEEMALQAGRSLEAARRERWRDEFYDCGELLDAYRDAAEAANQDAAPPVLLIDEVEKLPVPIQHILLQPFARGFVSIPKLAGVIGVDDLRRTPIVILTTNNLELLDDPLRDRCILTRITAPQPVEEIAIFRARVPHAPAQLIAGAAKLLKKIREDMDEIRYKPGIRNAVMLMSAMADHGLDRITAQSLEPYIGCLARGERDDINLRDALATLERAANRANAVIDDAVERAFKPELYLCKESAA